MYSELLLERNNLALEVTERHPRLQALDDRMREIRVEMRREVAAQIAALRTREEILNRQMGDLLQKRREVPAVELAMQRLQREAKSNDDLLALLNAKHQEALIKESEKIEEVSIVRPAAERDTPVGPRPSTPSWWARSSASRSAWSSPSCRRRSTPRSARSRTSRPTSRCRCSASCRTSTRARRFSGSSSADPPSPR